MPRCTAVGSTLSHVEYEMTMGGVPAGLQLGKQTGLRDRSENQVQTGFNNLSQISGRLMPGGLFLMFLSPL